MVWNFRMGKNHDLIDYSEHIGADFVYVKNTYE